MLKFYMTAKLVDSHAHLTDEQFARDIGDVIARARNDGLAYILNIASSVEDSKKSVALAERHDFIYSTVGVHPHEAKDEKDLSALYPLLENKKVIAVGETGLDYHYEYSPRAVQMDIFRKHIRLALEKKLPLIVHCRNAEEDVLEILAEEDGWKAGGVFHTFGGSPAIMDNALRHGWFLSFSGVITYPNAENLRNIAKEIPYENILIETDSPYLAPTPYRGKRNEPRYVRRVAETLSEILPLTFSDVCRITSANFERLFQLGARPERDTIAYPARTSLYLNITSRCTNECYFCVREYQDGVSGYYLWLQKEPTKEEILSAVENPTRYDEIVFCGFGEPTLRLEIIKEVARELKNKGAKKLRLTTNGHANIIHRRNIVPELKGLIDRISISLNAHNGEIYKNICKPKFQNLDVFNYVLEFIRECKKYIPEVEITAVAVKEADVKECERIADETGAEFRLRKYNIVG